jgi:hypothetical protein
MVFVQGPAGCLQRPLTARSGKARTCGPGLAPWTAPTLGAMWPQRGKVAPVCVCPAGTGVASGLIGQVLRGSFGFPAYVAPWVRGPRDASGDPCLWRVVARSPLWRDCPGPWGPKGGGSFGLASRQALPLNSYMIGLRYEENRLGRDAVSFWSQGIVPCAGRGTRGGLCGARPRRARWSWGGPGVQAKRIPLGKVLPCSIKAKIQLWERVF